MNDFKKNILTFIASRLDENNNDINTINQYFKFFDKDNDGQICFEEFQNVLINMNFETNSIKDLFNSLDVSKNGIINYTEFIAAFMQKDIYLKKEIINEAFTFFDNNNKGILTKEDIISAFNMKNNDNIEHFFDDTTNKIREENIDRNTFEE